MRGFAAIICAVFWSAAALAAETPAVGPAPDWVAPATAPAASADDSGPVQILLRDEQVRLSAEGKQAYVRVVARIGSPQGLRALGTITAQWRPEHQELVFHRVDIVRGDERIDALQDGSPLAVLRRENNLEYAMLDGVLTAVLQPEGLRVGDVVDYAVTVRGEDPVLSETPQHVAAGYNAAPISLARFRAMWPAGADVQWRAGEGVSGAQQRREGGMEILTWEAEGVAPPVFPQGAPPRFALGRRIELSGFETWNGVAAAFAPLYEEAATLAPDSPLHGELERIRAEFTDPRDRAAAVLRLAQDEVRYLFLGMNQGALTPASADQTWERRFGDCKGKTALILALLRELDIQAVPVAVSTQAGDGMDERLPMIGHFDHVLVRAQIGGRTYWLDGARSGDRALEDISVPPYRWGLELTADGGLDPIEIAPPAAPLIQTIAEIDASGGIAVPAPARLRVIYRGAAADQLQAAVAAQPEAQRDELVRRVLGGSANFTEPADVTMDYDEATAEQTMTLEGTVDLGWAPGGLHPSWARESLQTLTFSRPAGQPDAPFASPHPVYAVSRERLILPNGGEGFTMEGITEFDDLVGGLRVTRSAALENGVFEAEATMRSVALEFSADQAEAAQATAEELRQSPMAVRASRGYEHTEDERDALMAEAPSGPDDHMRRGRLLLEQVDYEAALEEFSAALEADPDHVGALAMRALIRVERGDLIGAGQDVAAARQAEPDHPIVRGVEGMFALRTGRLDAALDALTASIEGDPDNALTYSNRAAAWLAAGNYDRALADSAQAIRLAPGMASAYQTRATAYFRRGDRDAARAEIEAMMQDAPDDADTQRAGGAWLVGAGEHAAAEAAYRRSLALEPEAAPTWRMLGQLHIESGAYEDAVPALDRAIELGGRSWDLLNARGIAWAQQGEEARAEADFAAARGMAATPAMLNQLCWDKAIRNVALDAALVDCDAALARQPGNPMALDSRGMVYLQMGRFEEAVADFDAALAAQPDMAASLYARGVARLRAGDEAGGQADLAHARRLQPDIGGEYERYGVAP